MPTFKIRTQSIPVPIDRREPRLTREQQYRAYVDKSNKITLCDILLLTILAMSVFCPVAVVIISDVVMYFGG